MIYHLFRYTLLVSVFFFSLLGCESLGEISVSLKNKTGSILEAISFEDSYGNTLKTISTIKNNEKSHTVLSSNSELQLNLKYFDKSIGGNCKILIDGYIEANGVRDFEVVLHERCNTDINQK